MARSAIPFPTVIEQTGRNFSQYDLYSRLLKDRIIFIGDAITDDMANIVVAEMLFLSMDDPDKDISIYINSPGGSVTAGLAIYDTMQFVNCDVNTYCLGQAASMGALLLTAGTTGKRYALPHARIMIHQPWGGARGTASDISIQAKEILRLKEELNIILAEHTGRSLVKIEEETDRDYFMSAAEAKEYGLIDEVIDVKKKSKKKGKSK